MPARLLAYGGTSYSERRRIGSWPAIPESTLRDGYALLSKTWCYGMGVLERQPFLVLRRRQNVENRGGYPFCLLIDPGPAVWERFGWNGAAIIGAILASMPPALFDTPEVCSAETLESLLDRMTPAPLSASQDGLSSLVAASAVETVVASLAAAGWSERPEPDLAAASLGALPVCFRASAGWLVGGGSAHGRALGASLVIDDQGADASDGAAERGTRLLAAWKSARQRGLASDIELQPMWTWQQAPAAVLSAAGLVHDLENAPSVTEALMDRVERAEAMKEEIAQLAFELIPRGGEPLGAKASAAAIQQCLRDKRKLDERTVGRLDEATLKMELRKFGAPPKRIPKCLPAPRGLHVELWAGYLELLRDDVRKSLSDALQQLGDIAPEQRQRLVQAALAALPASPERLADWSRFQDDPEIWSLLEEPLRKEAQRRAPRSVKTVAEVPKPAPREIETRPTEDLTGLGREFFQVLFESERKEAPARMEALMSQLGKRVSAGMRTSMSEAVLERSADQGPRFAASFSGEYLALGDVMSLLMEPAQDRLIECLEAWQPDKFKAQTSLHLKHALNNRASRNAYSAALARFVLRNKALFKQVAGNMVEDPRDLERKLTQMLAAKPRH